MRAIYAQKRHRTSLAESTSLRVAEATARMRYLTGTITCSRCGKMRPSSLFRGRNKVPYPGREMLCRTCQAGWWRTGSDDRSAKRSIDLRGD